MDTAADMRAMSIHLRDEMGNWFLGGKNQRSFTYSFYQAHAHEDFCHAIRPRNPNNKKVLGKAPRNALDWSILRHVVLPFCIFPNCEGHKMTERTDNVIDRYIIKRHLGEDPKGLSADSRWELAHQYVDFACIGDMARSKNEWLRIQENKRSEGPPRPISSWRYPLHGTHPFTSSTFILAPAPAVSAFIPAPAPTVSRRRRTSRAARAPASQSSLATGFGGAQYATASSSQSTDIFGLESLNEYPPALSLPAAAAPLSAPTQFDIGFAHDLGINFSSNMAASMPAQDAFGYPYPSSYSDMSLYATPSGAHGALGAGQSDIDFVPAAEHAHTKRPFSSFSDFAVPEQSEQSLWPSCSQEAYAPAQMPTQLPQAYGYDEGVPFWQGTY